MSEFRGVDVPGVHPFVEGEPEWPWTVGPVTDRILSWGRSVMDKVFGSPRTGSRAPAPAEEGIGAKIGRFFSGMISAPISGVVMAVLPIFILAAVVVIVLKPKMRIG